MSEDRQFERMLRSAARRERPVGVCPDAAALAAYADGSLARQERSTLEDHVSRCLRCSEHLALLAGSDEPAPVEAGSRGVLRRWGWLVPVATAVLVFAVWTRTPAPESVTERAAPSREAAVPEAAQPSPALEYDALQQKTPSASGMDSGPAGTQELPAAPAAPVAKQLAPPPQPAEETTRGQLADEAREPRDDLATSPPAAPPPASAPIQRGQAEARQRSTAPAPPPATTEDQKGAPALRRFESHDTAAAEAARQEPAFEAAAKPQSAWQVVVVGETVQLRFAPGAIERSTDGGATWAREVTDAEAGLQRMICPGPETCWAGGAAGLVLRRQSDGTWARLRLPVALPVVALEAEGESALTATVTDGRRFTSVDGGVSWAPAP